MCSATQELRGLGLANLMGAAFNCYTTTGSFSRSAIMNDVGAKTQLAGIVSGELPRHLEVCVLQAEGSPWLRLSAPFHMVWRLEFKGLRVLLRCLESRATCKEDDIRSEVCSPDAPESSTM